MNKIQEFIDKYFALYIAECRVHNPFFDAEDEFNSPPTGEDLAAVMTYLKQRHADPLIIGSIAVIKHLLVTNEDIRRRIYRPTNRLEIIISGDLPPPPFGWSLKNNTKSPPTWVSPDGSRVDLFHGKDLFSEICEKLLTLNQDAESARMECPVADVKTLFFIKLELFSPRDLYDLLLLARKLGIPKKLNDLLSTPRQRKNLMFIRHWIKMHGSQP